MGGRPAPVGSRARALAVAGVRGRDHDEEGDRRRRDPVAPRLARVDGPPTWRDERRGTRHGERRIEAARRARSRRGVGGARRPHRGRSDHELGGSGHRSRPGRGGPPDRGRTHPRVARRPRHRRRARRARRRPRALDPDRRTRDLHRPSRREGPGLHSARDGPGLRADVTGGRPGRRRRNDPTAGRRVDARHGTRLRRPTGRRRSRARGPGSRATRVPRRRRSPRPTGRIASKVCPPPTASTCSSSAWR